MPLRRKYICVWAQDLMLTIFIKTAKALTGAPQGSIQFLIKKLPMIREGHCVRIVKSGTRHKQNLFYLWKDFSHRCN